MRGKDESSGGLLSYGDLDARVPQGPSAFGDPGVDERDAFGDVGGL